MKLNCVCVRLSALCEKKLRIETGYLHTIIRQKILQRNAKLSQVIHDQSQVRNYNSSVDSVGSGIMRRTLEMT